MKPSVPMLPTRPAPPFGDALELPEWVKSADVMLVAVQGYEAQPVQLLLPHQLYAGAIPGLLAKSAAADASVLVTPLVQPWLVVAGREAGSTWPEHRAPVDVARLQRDHDDLADIVRDFVAERERRYVLGTVGWAVEVDLDPLMARARTVLARLPEPEATP